MCSIMFLYKDAYISLWRKFILIKASLSFWTKFWKHLLRIRKWNGKDKENFSAAFLAAFFLAALLWSPSFHPSLKNSSFKGIASFETFHVHQADSTVSHSSTWLCYFLRTSANIPVFTFNLCLMRNLAKHTNTQDYRAHFSQLGLPR